MNKILYWIGQNFTHYCLAKTIQDKINIIGIEIIMPIISDYPLLSKKLNSLNLLEK